MKKVWNFITTSVLLVLILTIGVIFVPKFFGIEPMIVLSGSMEPTYHVGSLLYVKDANPDEIKEGDPITFYISDDTLVTHRVVEVDTVNKQYTTKGDANETIDGAPVFFDQVLGTPVFNIPKLGYLGDKLSSLSGKIIYITIIVVVIILMFLGDLIWPEQKEEKKKEEEESINEDINQ